MKIEMQKIKKNAEGFTLLETLLVLFIVSALILFPTLQLQQTTETVQIDLFFRELVAKITEMQTHAIVHGESTKVVFNPATKQIHFSVDEVDENEHPLAEVWIVENGYYQIGGKLIREFSFIGGTGNVTRSNAVNFMTTKGNYKLTYHLGSGHIDIQATN